MARHRASTARSSLLDGVDDTKYNGKNPGSFLSEGSFFVIFGYFLLLMLIAIYVHDYEPVALKLSDEPFRPGVFIEERARSHLKSLTALGPRPTGSYENEVLAVDYIVRQVQFIQQVTRSVHSIEIDVHKPSGSFNLDFQDGFTSSYVNVKNVLVKFEPSRGANHSVMLNCHYDSVPGSPGASDDAVSCSVMLEVLYLLSQSDVPMRHAIIFSFNGAEENILQASHGFITQHRWANKIKAFINLDSCGSGGRELLFQAGPENPWLIELYGRGAKYPFACIIAQELFQSGKIIPGDTDYRIFRDYGNIPGLDIAYVRNGYVYHTKYDIEEFISPGSVQRAGENVHGLILELANSPLVPNAGNKQHGSVIFFDFFGLFLVVYSELTGSLLVFASIAFVTYRTYFRFTRPRTVGFKTGRDYMKTLLKGVIVIVSAWILSLILLLLIAITLGLLGSSMSWFTNQILAFGLYVPPATLSMILIHRYAHHILYKNVRSPWLAEQLSVESHQFLWCHIFVLLYLLDVKTSMVLPVGMLIPTAFRYFANHFIYPRSKNYTRDFLIINLVGVALPVELSLLAAIAAIQSFIPMMGRVGPVVQPDIFIAVIIWIVCIISYNLMISCVHAVHSVKLVTASLLGVFIVSIVAAVFTPFGNPFHYSLSYPTPQRFMTMHVDRTLHDINGDIRLIDSGIWILPVDFKGQNDMYTYFPELARAHKVDNDCDAELMCGQPFYYPALHRLRKSVYLPGLPRPKFHQPLRMKLFSQQAVGINVRRLTFNLTGPSHMAIFMSPAADIDVVKWSFADGSPYPSLTWDSRPTYFVYHSQAENLNSFSFWVDIKVPINRPKGMSNFNIAAVAHQLHGDDSMSPVLQQFNDRFPDYVYTMGWPASYESWIF